MNSIYDLQAEQYIEIIQAMVRKLASHQSATDNEVPLSNNLIERLVRLKKMLADNVLNTLWFSNYTDIYQEFFFDPKLTSYTDLVSSDYMGIWKSLSLVEKIASAKLSDVLYRFPNMTILTNENLETKISSLYRGSTKVVANNRGLVFNSYRTYDPNFHVYEYTFNYAKEDQGNLAIQVWVFPGEIKIIQKNNGVDIEIAKAFQTMFLHNLLDQSHLKQ